MFNTIILKCGNARFANDDMERFEKYENMDPAEFLGDPEDFEKYKNDFCWYVEKIEYAKTMEELADILNEYSDSYGNGSRYTVEII